MMFRARRIECLFVLAALFLSACQPLVMPDTTSSAETGEEVVDQPAESTNLSQIEPLVQLDPERPIRILFIGNSNTSWNEGLDTHLMALAASVDPPIEMDADDFTAGGVMLWELWDESNVAEEIRQGDWDVVVLQNAGIHEPDRFLSYAAKFVDEIENAGALPILFDQWDDVNDPQSLASMQTCEELGIAMAHTGAAWAKAKAERPELEFSKPDEWGWHAGVPGTYLNTAVLYATLFGRSPEGTTYRPVDLLPDPESVKQAFKRDVERMHEEWQISDEDAAYLQSIAWKTVLESAGGQ